MPEARATTVKRWVVFRRVTEADYYGRYDIRVCQPHDGIECHPGCFADNFGRP